MYCDEHDDDLFQNKNETEMVHVHAYDWIVRDKYTDDDRVAIHCWALDKDSKPYLLRFTDC